MSTLHAHGKEVTFLEFWSDPFTDIYKIRALGIVYSGLVLTVPFISGLKTSHKSMIKKFNTDL